MSQEFQEAQKALYAKQCEECDVVITTALVPGKPAPKLVSKVSFEVVIDACFRANLMNFLFLDLLAKLNDQILNFVNIDNDLYFCESTRLLSIIACLLLLICDWKNSVCRQWLTG